MRCSRTALVLTIFTGLLLVTASPAASQGPPHNGGGPPPTGSASGFSLTEDITRLDLTREQLVRIKTLENDMNVKIESLLKELEECAEDDPYGRKAMELRSQINVVIEQSWRAMRDVLTEEQLRQLFIINPTHPLVQDEPPRFSDIVSRGGGSDTGPGPGGRSGSPPDHGGW